MTDFRETLYTINKEGHRKWVYADIVRGRFYLTRWIVAIGLILFYLSMPWITINGEQGIFLDIVNRRFVIFGSVFYATDTRFLALILAALGLSLFFFTALLGRIWCGWACPETVFLEFVFRPIETLIEGGPAKRIRLDQQPWNLEKIIKKGAKYLIFAALAWFLASTFLAYFVGAKPLLTMMADYPWRNPTPFIATCFMMGAMLFQFGWFREQFCTIVCPYARFQSVLLDSDSLLVGYDRTRGEPRGKMEKPGSERTFGDCIDCGLCVRVCPTGIDIRNGLQLECIQCAACADACDSIMKKIGRSTGLVRYSTERALEKGATRFIRPRVVLYAAALTLIGAAFTYLLSSRELSEFQIIREPRVAVFQELGDDKLVNQFHIHITNKSREVRAYTVEILDAPGVTAIVPGTPYSVRGGEMASLPVFVHFSRSDLAEGRKDVVATVRDDKGFTGQQKLTILGPSQ